MDRNSEYNNLLQEIETPFTGLENTVAKADAKLKTHKKNVRKYVKTPIVCMASFIFTFVVLVNSSSSFAYACGRIPLIKELAQAVAFSPSLSAAVENEFVQVIEQEQTKGDITARIEYIIVDQQSLDIFYTLSSDVYDDLDLDFDFVDLNNNELHSYCTGSGSPTENDLKQVSIDFIDNKMPEGMKLYVDVFSRDSVSNDDAPTEDTLENLISTPVYETPPYIEQFEFVLEFDPYYTEKSEIININQTFEIDGQTLTLETVEILPTVSIFNFAEDVANSSWLKDIEFYLENEKGEKFEGISNGISSTGNLESDSHLKYYQESTFFSDSTKLNLFITNSTWLDKDMRMVEVDLVNQTADRLPEGVEISKFEQLGNNWILTFTAPKSENNVMYQLFSHKYYDKDANNYDIFSTSSTINEENDDYFNETFPLVMYFKDKVYLTPAYSHLAKPDTDIEIKIK